MTGKEALHGGHHDAQKSYSTTLPFRSSALAKSVGALGSFGKGVPTKLGDAALIEQMLRLVSSSERVSRYFFDLLYDIACESFRFEGLVLGSNEPFCVVGSFDKCETGLGTEYHARGG